MLNKIADNAKGKLDEMFLVITTMPTIEENKNRKELLMLHQQYHQRLPLHCYYQPQGQRFGRYQLKASAK